MEQKNRREEQRKLEGLSHNNYLQAELYRRRQPNIELPKSI